MFIVRSFHRWIPIAIAVAVCGAGCQHQSSPLHNVSADHRVEAQPSAPTRLDTTFLPNAYRIHEKVISGGQPAGDPAFGELAALGVKTVISVDGAKPDIAGAKKHGLRYVHLPHGYDGIPEQRAKELAKAVRDLPGPIYIHCHHGRHRSPAAAAVACVATGFIEPSMGEGVLRTAGTSEAYQGLYASARQARRLDDRMLDELRVDYPETASIPPVAEAMVAMEHTHEHLKAIAASNWTSPSNHPDLDPSHEALLLREHFTELLRTEAVAQKPAAFQELLQSSESAAADLEAKLAISNRSDPAILARINTAFEQVSKNCTTCHRNFRDVPLKK